AGTRDGGDVVRVHATAELGMGRDGINGEADVPGAVHQVLVSPVQFVVVPVISGVFQQGDDVTALGQVRTEGSIEKMRAAGAMGNHNERELAFGDSCIRADVDGIRPKRSRCGRYAGRIQNQGWKRDALGLVVDLQLATTNEHAPASGSASTPDRPS